MREFGSPATIEENGPHPLQVEALRKMTPTRKWELVMASIQMARDLKSASVRAAHPDWPDGLVDAEVSRQILLASS